MCASCSSGAERTADAGFVRTFELDPHEVLGPPPADADLEVREAALAGV